MMMKRKIHLLTLGALLSAGANAQSVEDGVRAYCSGNYTSAINILQKHADKVEAAYFLAESYFQQEKFDLAKSVLEKAIVTKPNDPYLLAAKGHALLLDKKVAEATQSFDAAIAAAGKDDESKAKALNAVGNAVTKVYNNVDKVGDINYAIQKLTEAKNLVLGMKEKKRDPKLVADIYTNLADATLKANPGEGSSAFTFYQEATASDLSSGKAEYRKSKIFKSQNNVELYLQSLEKAAATDPPYFLALNDLFDYYIFSVQDFTKAKPYGDKMIALLPASPNNEYFKAVGAYYSKNYTEAINISKNIIAKAGAQTKPEVYKLIAYSLIESKDTVAAIPFVENYFKNQAKEDIKPFDYTLKATAYSTTPGKESEVVQTYMEAAAADTSIAGKIKVLGDGAKLFSSGGKEALAGDLYAKILEIKPVDKLSINDFFYAGYSGYYKSGQYEKSWKIFDAARKQFPKWNYGYMLAYNSSKIFDSTNAQNIMIGDGDKYITYLQSADDTSDVTLKRAEVFKTATNMAIFFANVKKDNDNALKYLHIAYNNADDPAAKEQIAGYIKAMGGKIGSASGGSDNVTGSAPVSKTAEKSSGSNKN